jgi:hypothetical protein
MHDVGCKYLENTVGISLVHLETLDGHGGSQVFSVAHVCEPTVVVNVPDAYEVVLKDV